MHLMCIALQCDGNYLLIEGAYLGLDRGRCCRRKLRAKRAQKKKKKKKKKKKPTPTKWLPNWRDNRVTFIDHAKGVVTLNYKLIFLITENVGHLESARMFSSQLE